MITHVVMVKLKDPSPDNLNSAVKMIRDLVGKIDVLKSMEVGTDVVHSERSYDLVLIAQFVNLDDLRTYNIHPIHVPVLEYVRSLASSMAAVDFES